MQVKGQHVEETTELLAKYFCTSYVKFTRI